MDPTRFDTLTKSLGQARSRRTVLRTLGGAALGALGLAGSGRRAGAAPGGNSACAHFCATVFGADTPEADACTSEAAHGTGLCYQCGPAAQGTGLTLCGTVCVDTTSDTNNCGSCGQACGGTTPVCAGGTCVCTTSSCAAGETCSAGACCQPATTCPAGQTCGTAPDGCGGTLHCGTCAPNELCCRGTCKLVAGQSCGGNAACASGVCCGTAGCCLNGQVCSNIPGHYFCAGAGSDSCA